MGAQMADDALTAVLADFVKDLAATDMGLWELSWMAAGRTNALASTQVRWARLVMGDLVDREAVHLSVTSWPSMTPEREMGPVDWAVLVTSDAPWHDPGQATILVLVQLAAEPSAL